MIQGMMEAPEGSTPVAWMVFAITLAGVLVAFMLQWRAGSKTNGAVGNYKDRDYVAHQDLVDPAIRGDHLTFNTHLHNNFAGQRFIPVRGEEGCFLAFTHATCKEAMNDHATFSSNPFAEDRLVALNTLSKADHSRVLRYVHTHYSQTEVGQLDKDVSKVIERCTDELERGECDAVMWAKRIHMASTLTRLGLDWEQAGTWEKVDEVVMLNDAMVYLVAPLGGVGKQYSSVPRGQWFWVFVGMLRSLLPTFTMFRRFGFRCTWEIVRPDVTVLFPPAAPRMGLWWHPELLPLVPQYFLSLYDLMQSTTSAGPMSGIREGVATGDLKLEEALTLLVQLMVNMTSANALANMVYRLATEEAAAQEVSADPERLCPVFVQEVLRLDAPLQRNPRRVAKQPERKWKDSPLKVGDHVLLLLGAANMDPAVHEKPEEFRLDRPGDKGSEVTFGSGIHYCLGSNLVKMEMRLALECLLRRYKSVELQGDYQRLVDVDVGNWGFRRLGVQLHSKAA